MSNKPLPTADELVSTLKRTNLPTIVIEGKDDVYIYRWLKQKLNTSLVSLFPCGGRNTLFKVHDRKAEFSDKNVVFVADKDGFVFEGVDRRRSDIIFTTGYCIENDIYAGSEIKRLLDSDDIESYEVLRNILCLWFAFEVQQYLNKKSAGEPASLEVAKHLNQIIPLNSMEICPNISSRIESSPPTEDLLALIVGEYPCKLRGKQIFQLLARFMSAKGRFSKFDDKNLVEIALKTGENNYMDLLVNKIDSQLAV